MGDSVFINGRAAVHKGSGGKSQAFPDVCLCPPGPPAGPVPTPLVNTVVAADMDDGATSVLIEGNPAGTRRSFFRKSTGNEMARATGGGIMTGAVQGKAHFRFSHARNVFFEGEPAVRHGDTLTHNHVAFSGNTPPAPWTSKVDPATPRRAPRAIVKQVGRGRHWIRLSVVDEGGDVVIPTRFVVQTPSGKEVTGRFLAGGLLTVEGIDAGSCEVRFPDVDERCRELGRTKAPERHEADDLVYRPGSSLRLPTDKAYRIVVPGMATLFVEVVARHDQRAGADERLVLRSTDGAYSMTRPVPRRPRNKSRMVTLEFGGLLPGREYTLVHERGGKAGAHEVFSRQPFERLFARQDGDEGAIVQRLPISR